jgi:hypothetical protein
LGSSGIGASLQELKISARYLSCLAGLAIALLSIVNLAAQAPSSRNDSHESSLPRFTLREIIAGHNDSLARIPGRWVNAALAAVPDSLAMNAYRTGAARSRLLPLEGSILASLRSQYVMGLYRRSELTDAVRATLEAIRSTLPSDTVRARFDAVFRPRGEWIVDLHDAALAWARARHPQITWESPRRALTAIHRLPGGDSGSSSEAVPWALYSLTVLAANDSAAFHAVRSDLWKTDSTSGNAVVLLLQGYAESQRWYVDALEFFLTQPWAPYVGRHLSVVDHVRNYWRRPRTDGAGLLPQAPQIRAHLFGHPQAVPHYGVPSRLFQRLISADNAGARAWLDRHGESALLRALRRLPAGDTTLVLLQTGGESLRLTTVSRQSTESLNGFLEPRDAIAIDPGYSPLLALGAVVHEWQHLHFRRQQLDAFVSRLPPGVDSIIELPWLDPYLAEGFAEWSTEQILAPLAERWPLLYLAELQKRAALAAGPKDQHALGYALVRTLGAVLRDRAGTVDLLLRHAAQPSRILSHPSVRQAWRRYGTAGDPELATPAQRILIPEVTFTVEDGHPDVIASRILIPAHGAGQR